MGIRSKYSLLDATIEVVRRVTDKGLMATWSANIIMKDTEARAMWTVAWPKMYTDLDARSKPGNEGDPASTASEKEERPIGDTNDMEVKKLMALLETRHDLNIPQDDGLQALVAEEYEDEIDMTSTTAASDRHILSSAKENHTGDAVGSLMVGLRALQICESAQLNGYCCQMTLTRLMEMRTYRTMQKKSKPEAPSNG